MTDREARLGCLWWPWNAAKTLAAIAIRIVVPLFMAPDDD